MDEVLTPVVIATRYAVVEQRMVQQEIDTPQGRMVVQQPVQIPRIFRGHKEIQRYIEEQCKEYQPIVIQPITYDIEHEDELEFYYEKEE